MIFTVAIDGPAAAGKGTIARAVAERFGFAHLDTGLLYRATGAKVLEGSRPLEAARNLRPADLRGAHLRTAEVGQAASRVAAMPDVRAALFSFQKRFARREGGAVLDGRDIGTVISPEAEVKLFVTASDAARAHRRWLELTEAGQSLEQADVLAQLQERDRRDAERDAAPMVAAEDAVVLDTSDKSIDQAVAEAIALIERRYQRET